MVFVPTGERTTQATQQMCVRLALVRGAVVAVPAGRRTTLAARQMWIRLAPVRGAVVAVPAGSGYAQMRVRLAPVRPRSRARGAWCTTTALLCGPRGFSTRCLGYWPPPPWLRAPAARAAPPTTTPLYLPGRRSCGGPRFRPPAGGSPPPAWLPKRGYESRINHSFPAPVWRGHGDGPQVPPSQTSANKSAA